MCTVVPVADATEPVDLTCEFTVPADSTQIDVAVVAEGIDATGQSTSNGVTFTHPVQP